MLFRVISGLCVLLFGVIDSSFGLFLVLFSVLHGYLLLFGVLVRVL